jgi:hypothetical protein
MVVAIVVGVSLSGLTIVVAVGIAVTVESFYNEKLGNIKSIRYNEFRFDEISIV